MELKWSESLAAGWSDVWPWLAGLGIAMGIFFAITDVALGTTENGHTGSVIGKTYTPPWTTPGYWSRSCDSKNHCTSSYHPPVHHPPRWSLDLQLDSAGDGSRDFDVSEGTYDRTERGAVFPLWCRRGCYTKHLYCALR